MKRIRRRPCGWSHPPSLHPSLFFLFFSVREQMYCTLCFLGGVVTAGGNNRGLIQGWLLSMVGIVIFNQSCHVISFKDFKEWIVSPLDGWFNVLFDTFLKQIWKETHLDLKIIQTSFQFKSYISFIFRSLNLIYIYQQNHERNIWFCIYLFLVVLFFSYQ